MLRVGSEPSFAHNHFNQASKTNLAISANQAIGKSAIYLKFHQQRIGFKHLKRRSSMRNFLDIKKRPKR